MSKVLMYWQNTKTCTKQRVEKIQDGKTYVFFSDQEKKTVRIE